MTARAIVIQEMAFAGTVIGVILSVPLAILAARSLTPHISLYYAARWLIALFRTVPDLVWALFFVVTVGLGPFAGMLTLVVDAIGFCGRFFAEYELESVRGAVMEAFGPPTVAFSHAEMEARGIEVADLTVNTLLYVDDVLPDAQQARLARRLRTAFNPTGAELFSLTNTRLYALARLLGPDFRGAIVQISESGWTHHSTVSTILLDLQRAHSIFRLDG